MPDPESSTSVSPLCSSVSSMHGVLQPWPMAAGMAHGTEPRTPQNRTCISRLPTDGHKLNARGCRHRPFRRATASHIYWPPMVWDVLGIGANSVDYVYRLPAYPERDGPNAKMRISSHSLSCGGQVATALCTCAAMGLRAKYIGATGTDDNGRRIRDELMRRGIDTTDAVIRDVTNQFAVIMVDERAGERIVLWDRHEGLRLRPRELPEEVIASAR